MRSKIYAVIDTNVLVSALISKSIESNPVKVFRAIIQGKIIPLYNDEILSEYNSVLSRDKFHLDKSLIKTVLKAIVTDGLSLDKTPATDIDFPDRKDIVFYEIALSKSESYLVTGNLKHFPAKPFVVSPSEMISILESDNNTELE
ncbi:MAG TPA: putative toxin-antitoxin system toxin component, PIN family [Rikenellaceae bacterium]|nr:putative toxin-antitoxin system toxin component, PIN family [Rikenellaceae bacterium]